MRLPCCGQDLVHCFSSSFENHFLFQTSQHTRSGCSKYQGGARPGARFRARQRPGSKVTWLLWFPNASNFSSLIASRLLPPEVPLSDPATSPSSSPFGEGSYLVCPWGPVWEGSGGELIQGILSSQGSARQGKTKPGIDAQSYNTHTHTHTFCLDPTTCFISLTRAHSYLYTYI